MTTTPNPFTILNPDRAADERMAAHALAQIINDNEPEVLVIKYVGGQRIEERRTQQHHLSIPLQREELTLLVMACHALVDRDARLSTYVNTATHYGSEAEMMMSDIVQASVKLRIKVVQAVEAMTRRINHQHTSNNGAGGIIKNLINGGPQSVHGGSVVETIEPREPEPVSAGVVDLRSRRCLTPVPVPKAIEPPEIKGALPLPEGDD